MSKKLKKYRKAEKALKATQISLLTLDIQILKSELTQAEAEEDFEGSLKLEDIDASSSQIDSLVAKMTKAELGQDNLKRLRKILRTKVASLKDDVSKAKKKAGL